MVSIASIRVRALVRLKDRRFAAPLRVLRSADRVGRIARYYLADHHPIEQHPQSSQSHLHRRLGLSLQLQFDKGRDVGPARPGRDPRFVLGTERGELSHRLAVGAAGIGVADVRAEEVPHSRLGFRSDCED